MTDIMEALRTEDELRQRDTALAARIDRLERQVARLEKIIEHVCPDKSSDI